MGSFENSRGVVIQDKQATVNHGQVQRDKGKVSLLGFRKKLERVVLNKILLEKNKSSR